MKFKTAIFTLLLMVAFSKAFAGERLIVFGLDETGSYSFRKKAISIANTVIADLAPGEIFYARRITANSYRYENAIFRLEIPRLGEPPTNEFNKKARYLWSRKATQINAMKTQAMRFMEELKPVNPPKTDIWGFIAAAADRIGLENHIDAKPMLIIASDMIDNCYRKVKVDLQEAEVIIAGFESGNDPRKSQEIRTRWIKAFHDCNASKVTFLPPDFHLVTNQKGR